MTSTPKKKRQARGAARILGAEQFEDALARQAAMSNQVENILETAKREADRILKDAEQLRADKIAEIEAMSEERLVDFIDRDRLRRHADVFVRMLDEIARIRSDFEALNPWLVELVETVLRRVVGELEPTDLASRLIGQAIEELESQYAQTLYIHPGSKSMLTAAIRGFPDRFKGVKRIAVDANLTPGAMRLHSETSVLDIDLEAQIARVQSILETTLPRDGTPKVTR